jgi:tRNA nucleotidyltransferase/poly(A) polymerase/2'-5' RNA ligase
MESGCKKAPEMECIWADGRGRAWFCKKHFDVWSQEDTEDGMPKDIVKQRKVPDGVVGEKYGEYPQKKEARTKTAKANFAVISGKLPNQWPTGPVRVVDRDEAIEHQRQGGVVIAGFGTKDEADTYAKEVETAEIDVHHPDGSVAYSGSLMGFSEVAPKMGMRFVDIGRTFSLLRDPSAQLGRGPNALKAQRKPPKGQEQADSSDSGDDTAKWEAFLSERYEGGKKQVPNTNPKTRDRYPEVAFSTLLKTDPRFRKKIQEEFARWRAGGKTAKATGRKTGDGHGVGLFIPLPKVLAKKFPGLGENDDSPSHVTFLYIGDFQGDETEQEHLVDALRGICKRWWPGAKATLGPVDYFVHEDKDRVVPHVTVDFDKDLSGFRHRVKQDLLEAGFPVDDKFPEYKPHVTLAYLPGLDNKWKGSVPKGSWKFDQMEVWGLPKVHKIHLGPSINKVSDRWLDQRLVRAAVKVAGWWAEEEEDVLTGDDPADHAGQWLDELDLIYRTSLGRPASPEEITATFDFVFRPVETGDLVLNEWFDGFVEWLGLPATEISWSLEVWNAISWFFRQVRNHGALPDIWATLEAVRDDLLRLNALEYPGDTAEGQTFEGAVLEKLDFLQDYWMDTMFPDELDDAQQRLVQRVSEQWLGKVASRVVESSIHRRNIALMQWLSDVTRKLGVARDTYIVGGAVRNFLINQPIKDIDVVIDSVRAGKDSDWLAQQIARAVPAPTNVTTNQYGVAILTVKGDWMLGDDNLRGEVLEIANARKESYGGETGKGYKPHTVAPAMIEEDVLRREFSFNTLLWRLMDLAHGPDKAEVIDLTGCGRRDLDEGVLRCPRDPDVVFSDDPTRMLRAIKFTGRYGFKIPPDLARSIKKNAPMMKRMPWEAIATILVGDVLNQPTARKSLVQMRELGLLDVISEMIQEQKPFATYMANQLRTNRKVQLLLDLMDLGVPAQTPINFLDRSGQQRLRDLTVGMPEHEAIALVDSLIKPPVDSQRIIDTLALAPADRGKITPTARHLILQDPALAHDRGRLTSRVIEEMRR